MNTTDDNGRELYWQKVQAVTGLLFALFVFTHLSNTLLAIGGPELYDRYQETARRIYQHPIVEIVLLVLVLPAHIVAGVVRARIRRVQGVTPPSIHLRVHRWAGWFLLIVVYWHAAAVRLPSLFFEIWPAFAGVAFSIQWVPAWFYPYYFLLALAGLYHALNGSRLALVRLRFGKRRLRTSHVYVIASIGAIAIAVNLLAFGGVWFDVGDPMRSDYGQLYLGFLNQWF